MTNAIQNQADILRDRFGLKVAARLSESTTALPHDISERLRAARVQALSRRKVVRVKTAAAVSVTATASGALLLGGDEGLNLWRRLASALPLIALVAGLLAINFVQTETRANELAEVDAALLTDDLPPAAYTDPGFVQFVKTNYEPNR